MSAQNEPEPFANIFLVLSETYAGSHNVYSEVYKCNIRTNITGLCPSNPFLLVDQLVAGGFAGTRGAPAGQGSPQALPPR